MKNIREDLSAVIEATRLFYNSPHQGMAMIHVKNIAEVKGTPLKLSDYCFPKDRDRYLDHCAENLLHYWKERISVKDHCVPALGPWYGIAEHSSFLGGVVEYSDETSWHHVLLEQIGDLSQLSMSMENDTYQMVVGGIAYIREKYGDLFAPMVRGTSGVLEIANALRGNDFFCDFYEYPQETHALLKYCQDAILWYYGKQLDAAGEFMGGVVTGFGEWLPGRPIGHMSEDTTAMISRELYEEFGRPYTQHICGQFDGAFMHTHALSAHCLGSIGDIRGIQIMEISSDPNTDRAIEVYRRHKAEIKPIPVLNLTAKEITDNMDLLKTQKTLLWYQADTVKEAEEICQLVKKELPIR